MNRWLAFGLSGPVGRGVLAGWQAHEAAIDAVSRAPQPARDGLAWQAGDLADWTPPRADYAAVLSLGPLDRFAGWFADSGVAAARVVALGSTSVHAKAASPAAAERELAARLAAAEDRLAAACAARGATLTLLRPTLIYGLGRDRSLGRLVELARRWRVLPLPRGARGRRQPVHAGDVAAAVLAALRTPAGGDGRFDLPGGETLAWDEMVRRTLRIGAPGARLLPLPDPVFALALRTARAAGFLADAGAGVLSRLGEDLVYDPAPAVAALGWRPGPFRPDPAMFAGTGPAP